MCFVIGILFSQSIMQEELNYYNSLGISAEEYEEINIPRIKPARERVSCNLNKMVFGWHPYWANGLEDNYDWNLISDFCYFSYEVDYTDGSALSTHGWSTNNAVDTALARGINVHLCVTLFDNHAAFFGNATAVNNLITNLVNAVQTRGADGINIDFEGVPSSQATNLTNFMINLKAAMVAANPSLKLSICLYAVDWNNVFNEVSLNTVVDFFTIMGYDYYGSFSSTAGPNDPLYGYDTPYDYSLSKSVTYYRNNGLPANKLIIGLPYYGKEWGTTTSSLYSPTTGSGFSNRTYKFVKDNISGNYSTPIHFDRCKTTWYSFAGPKQCFISMENDLADRYEFVHQRGLGGIGIWALSYDDGYNDLWNEIENHLTDCRVVPCVDTIVDGGGPGYNYYNNENYAYTISPDGAVQVNLTFLSFSTEAGYDTLFLYDGNSTLSPLIGSYTGTTSPGTVSSTGLHLTLRFKSDNATVSSGFKAYWSCIQDNVSPTTLVTNANVWWTTDENINFTDNDNISVESSLWSVQERENTEWYANNQLGFWNDNYNVISPNINLQTGTWNHTVSSYTQSDESLTNTNAYINLNQNDANEYLYEWRAKTSGAGSNKRSGFHFMCNSPTLTNRGISYFVWFRMSTQLLEIYEVNASDVFTLVASFPTIFMNNTWYDYKTRYNKLTGKITVWQDGVMIGEWIDSTPIITGNAISFRSGNSILEVDRIQVSRNRSNSELVSIGNSSTNMLRYCNSNPTNSAGRIISTVIDEANLFGKDTLVKDVDFTIPNHLGNITETLLDEDTIVNLASFYAYNANWTDTNSNMNNYYYGIGNVPFLDNIQPFTLFTTIDSIEIFTSSFTNGSYYYNTIIGENGAGLKDTISSDGFLYINNSSIGELNSMLLIYPNPADDQIQILLDNDIEMVLYTIDGKIIYRKNLMKGLNIIPTNNLHSGNYIIQIGNQKYKLCVLH